LLLAISFLAAGDAFAATKTYTLPDTLTVTGGLNGTFTYGVSGEIVDHAFDGQTVTINSISVAADGNAVAPGVNFDWQFWFNDAPMGLTPGGAVAASDYSTILPATTPASYTTGWHFVDGDVNMQQTGAFQLQGAYDFSTQVGSGAPGYNNTVVGTSTPTTVANGLYLQVSAWSGDGGANGGVDFTMSNIAVTIDYAVAAAPVAATPAPALNAWMLALLAVLLAGAVLLRRIRESAR